MSQEPDLSRYIVVGAGAVGGTIGARLFESGHQVVLVARGQHYEAIREHGLRFRAPDGRRTLPIPVIDRPEALEPGRGRTSEGDSGGDDGDDGDSDVLIFATKTQDSAAALDAWAAHTRQWAASPPVILAQNGVENERLALRRFPRVYGMCVWLPATHLESGVIESQGTPISGVLHLGRYPDGEDDVIRRVADDLGKSGFHAPVRPDVMRWKYSKLLGNLGNAVEALCGPLRGDEAEELTRRVRAEGIAVLDAAAIPYTSPEEEAPMRELLRLGNAVGGAPRGGGSSWQSLARGAGSIESDYLNGEIALLGRLHAVPTPANETLQRLATLFARDRRAPGSLTVAELSALIDSVR